MPRRPKHPCRYPGCPGLAEPGKSYCPEHQDLQLAMEQAARERWRQRARPGSAAERGYDARWREVRARQLQAFPFCQRCGRRATLVHHIDGNAHNDDMSNLMSLCDSCHQKVHHGG